MSANLPDGCDPQDPGITGGGERVCSMCGEPMPKGYCTPCAAEDASSGEYEL